MHPYSFLLLATVVLLSLTPANAARVLVAPGSWEAYESKAMEQYHAGTKKDAEASLQQALVVSCSFAPGDERAYTTHHDLAQVYEELGHVDQAVSILQKLLVKQEKELWEGHPYYLETLHHLEKIYARHNLIKEGLVLTKRHVELERRVFGPNAWQSIETLRTRCFFLSQSGQAQQAMPILVDLIVALEKVRKPGDPDLYRSRMSLGYMYWQQQTEQSLAKARTVFEKILASKKPGTQCQGPDGNLYESYFYLGAIYRAQKHVDKAKPLLYQALLCAREVGFKDDNPFYSSIYWHLALCYAAENDYKQAAKLDRQAIAVMEKANPGNSTEAWLKYRSGMLKTMREFLQVYLHKVKEQEGGSGG